MVVEDYMNVLGRGWLIIAYGEEYAHTEVLCGSKIVRGDTIFIIEGVERTKYDDNWWGDRVGLILSPNNLVPDCFEIGEEIEIIYESGNEQEKQ